MKKRNQRHPQWGQRPRRTIAEAIDELLAEQTPEVVESVASLQEVCDEEGLDLRETLAEMYQWARDTNDGKLVSEPRIAQIVGFKGVELGDGVHRTR